MAETQSCTLNRSWVLKTGAFMVILLGFGCWALYDAVILYPNRGLGAASKALHVYLERADRAGFLLQDQITVAEPKAQLADLEGRLEALRVSAAADTLDGRKAAMELAKYEWLNALDRAWKLTPEPKFLGEFTAPAHKSLWFDPAKGEGYTTTSGPGAGGGAAGDGKAVLSPQLLLNELGNFWSASEQPTPLSAFDLPVQWLFVVIGFGLGAYLVFLMLKCKALAMQHRFDAGEQRLTIPGGASMVPADLEDVDKRLWHKYFVTLITKDGAAHKLDLLRYVPLEQWVLAMEETRFPERVAEEKKRKAEAEAADGGEAEEQKDSGTNTAA